MSDLELATTPTPTALGLGDIQQQAEILARSQIIPRRYQGKPDDVIAAALMGRVVGFHPITSLQMINIVEGKAEISAEGMVALIRKAGHSITGEASPESATVRGKRCDNGDQMSATFSQEDANRAKLAGKDNWRKYPEDMLWARAVSRLRRRLFPDVGVGFSYVEGELSGADLELGEPVVPPPVEVIDTAGRTLSMTGPTVYVPDEEVQALLELVQSDQLSDGDREAYKAEAERMASQSRSWSFAAGHRWERHEFNQAKAWIYGRAGLDPLEPVRVDVETGEKHPAGPITQDEFDAAWWVATNRRIEIPDYIDDLVRDDSVAQYQDEAAKGLAWMQAEIIKNRQPAPDPELADPEAVEALKERIDDLGEPGRLRLRAQRAKVTKAGGSWSFKPEHVWTVREVEDCLDYVVGLESYERSPQPEEAPSE